MAGWAGQIGRASPNVISTLRTDPDANARLGSPSDRSSSAY
ncbi:hypothetical protein I552_2824 [Mycobacterium xenopi 3993]|nr:hypothetical protein I552_2824 [Mycobacterium xenopi 3993]